MGKSAKRLIDFFQPEHYELSIIPDSNKLRFEGTVSITGKVVGKPSQRLTFHQVGLKISEASVEKQDKTGPKTIKIDRINNQAKLHEVRLHSTEKLFPGSYTVSLKFSGVITPSMQGIYASRFTYKGKEKVILATQLESHHARSVFPCIDEPEAKATFKLTVAAPKDLTVLSNTEIEETKKDGELIYHSFKQTPIMSTYLLAFVIGELHYAESKTKSGIHIRSWASIAQDKSHLDFSAEEGARILDFFTEYFDTPYPLSKCDQIALPDFDAGAMENWGMITYREVALLTDPDNRSITNEQYVAMVVAHELSHQWFGNLVTMKWWDDLWLNESFASLMEHIALNALHPDWQQWEHYASSDILATTSRDIYKDVQAVSVEVTDPDLIESLFDPGIVYAKGGRLLKMLVDYIGEEAFRKGLKAYFTKHAYGNASREDLWKALGEASHLDISGLMTPWLLQPGMPLVTVEQDDTSLSISQQRFLLDGKEDKTIWPIPLLPTNPLPKPIFDKATDNIKISSSEPVVLNSTASGHYVTLYKNANHREALYSLMQTGKLPAETRLNILNDSYLLARHGDLPLSAGLDIVWASANEERDTAWTLMIRLVSAAQHLTEGSDQSERAIKALKRYLAYPHYTKLGWDDAPTDDPNTLQLRHTMLALMIGADDPEAMEQAYVRYKAADDVSTIAAEIRSSILIASARLHPETVIKELMEAYPEATADIQNDICLALTSVREEADAEMIIKAMLGDKGLVRAQDLLRWLALGVRNAHIRNNFWQFIKKNWAWVEETLERSKSFDYLPIYIAGVGSDEKWLKEFEDFFSTKQSIKVLKQNIGVGISDIKARIAWRKRDEQLIIDWLSHHV